MLKIRIDPVIAKSLIEAFTKLVDEVYFIATKEKLMVSQVDSSKVIGIYMEIAGEGLPELVVDEEKKFGISSQYLKIIARMINKRSDKIFEMKEGQTGLILRVEGRRIRELEVPMLPPGDLVVDVSMWNKAAEYYKDGGAVITYTTDEFYRQIDELRKIAKDATVVVKAVGNTISMELESQNIKYRGLTIFESLMQQKAIKSSYSVDYLHQIASAAKKIGTDCTILIGEMKPISIEVPIAGGKVRLMLAPRVEQ